MANAEEQLEAVWAAARQAAVAGRCRVDPRIPESELDYGLGVGMVIVPDMTTIAEITSAIENLRVFDSGQYWYPPESLHITVHGVSWRPKSDLPTETEFQRLVNSLRPALHGVGLPELTLKGPTIFPGSDKQLGSISLQGFPNSDLLLLRDRLRQSAMDAGYPDRRNYTFGRGDYLTCTIARLRKQPAPKLVEQIGELRAKTVSKFYVTEILLASSSYFFKPENTKVRERFNLNV